MIWFLPPSHPRLHHIFDQPLPANHSPRARSSGRYRWAADGIDWWCLEVDSRHEFNIDYSMQDKQDQSGPDMGSEDGGDGRGSEKGKDR